MARALGAHGERVERPDEFKAAITRALKQPNPVVLDVIIKPLEPRP